MVNFLFFFSLRFILYSGMCFLFLSALIFRRAIGTNLVSKIKHFWRKQSVSLRLASEERCKFIKKTTREEESKTKYVTEWENDKGDKVSFPFFVLKNRLYFKFLIFLNKNLYCFFILN